MIDVAPPNCHGQSSAYSSSYECDGSLDGSVDEEEAWWAESGEVTNQCRHDVEREHLEPLVEQRRVRGGVRSLGEGGAHALQGRDVSS